MLDFVKQLADLYLPENPIYQLFLFMAVMLPVILWMDHSYSCKRYWNAFLINMGFKKVITYVPETGTIVQSLSWRQKIAENRRRRRTEEFQRRNEYRREEQALGGDYSDGGMTYEQQRCLEDYQEALNATGKDVNPECFDEYGCPQVDAMRAEISDLYINYTGNGLDD